MVTRLLLFMVALMLAGTVSAAPQVLRDSKAASELRYVVTFDTTTTASELMAVRGLCVATFVRAGSETVSLYQTTANTATGGTLVATFSATTTSPQAITVGQPNLYASSNGATAGGSLTIHCSPLQVSDTGGVVGSGTLAQMNSYADPQAGDMWQLTDDGNQTCTVGGGVDTAFICQWDAIAEGWVPVDTLSGSVTGLTNPLLADIDASTFDINSPMGTGAASTNFPSASITIPATTTMGSGVTWGSDQVAKDRPGGAEIDVRNHQLGFFYNKAGVNGTITTACQPAWDWSHETNYRTTSATGDDTWPELNFDLWSPRYTTVPTGVTGTFAAADYIEFSGGGFGKVVSWSGGTLTYVHTWGPCAANAQTITNRTGTGAGTVASLTSTQTTAGQVRALQFEWDSAEPDTESNGPVRWTFDTLEINDTRPSALRIRNSGVGIYLRDAVSRRLHVQNDGLFNTQALAMFEHDEAVSSGLNQNADILEIRHDYGANANTHSYARGINLLGPLNGGSVSLGRQHAIHIQDWRGLGPTDSSVIMIEAQTGTDGGDGNVTFEGGNYNNGHLTFGAEGAAGDHLWRDQTNERWRTETDSLPTSESDGRPLSETAAINGTAALGTSLIASGDCATVVTAAVTGIVTTDVVSWSFNADVTAVTGYAPVTTGALSIYAYPTSGNVNFKVCNPTASSITPGAVTLNYNVIR